MSYAKDRWATVSGASNQQVYTNMGNVQPIYFKEAYFSGEDTNPGAYGGIIPIVALYQIDWATYNSDFGITG
jgi:hypothetical protein